MRRSEEKLPWEALARENIALHDRLEGCMELCLGSSGSLFTGAVVSGVHSEAFIPLDVRLLCALLWCLLRC